MKLGEAMYQAGAQAEPDAGSTEADAGPDGDQSDEQVVDADFEEVDDDDKGKTA